MRRLRKWRFLIGDHVDHVEGGMPAVISGLVHQGLGVYWVTRAQHDGPERNLMIFGESLVAVPAG